MHVALVAPNSYSWIVAYFALFAVGNTVILINPDMPVDVLEEQFAYADVSVVCSCCTENHYEQSNSGRKWITFEEMISAEPCSELQLYDWQPHETVAMMFTSGTTGKGKVVEYTAENIFSHLDDLEARQNYQYTKMMLVAPLYHIMGISTVMARIILRYTICIGRGARYIISDIPVLNPSNIMMPPAVLESIVKLLKKAEVEERPKYIGKNLERISVGGAAVNKELLRYMMQLGIVVETGYGMTETAGAGTGCELDENNITTNGKPYGKTQMRVCNGELQIKSPSLMKGCYKDPEETARVIEDGWIHTGDMGYCDDDGYYYITGRKKNVIILSNGENVNPEEIEAAWGTCKAIEECLVYSNGRGICADVYTKDPEAASVYINNYNESMPMYRQVYKVNYTDQPLPKTASGKIIRKENRQ